ncbi:MAG: flagellar export chaperone FliS [Deltaproteobacteria bacterium]|nr:flagellar export chaperone FliS [Deltaproteobacteria bacterium]MBW2138891.1 flagellar export chaperone FliS [Deltaproteobacteria bacterium]
MVKSGVQAYMKTNVFTSDPSRLVLMCYEGAIDNLNIADKKLAERDYEGKSKSLGKAKDFIEELLFALDFERGGAIARNLDSLYNYMLRRIIFADLRRDSDAINEITSMLNELKEAWETALLNQDKTMQPRPGLSAEQWGRQNMLATGS